jgi:hypothetical protein
MELSDTVIESRCCEEVLNGMPTTGRCIIITDSLILSSDREKKLSDATRFFAIEAKKKNPDCITILNSVDFAIDSCSKGSFEKLLDVLKDLAADAQ